MRNAEGNNLGKSSKIAHGLVLQPKFEINLIFLTWHVYIYAKNSFYVTSV